MGMVEWCHRRRRMWRRRRNLRRLLDLRYRSPVQPMQTTETQSNATLPAPRNAAEVPILSGGDVRDLLIAQQVRRIDELEREVAALRAELHRK